jgi:hypothetical protein
VGAHRRSDGARDVHTGLAYDPAELRFDADGYLAEFTSDDRSMASKDGRSFREARWSTPVSDYTVYGSHRLARRGSAVWTLPEGAFEYARFEVVEVEYNPRAGRNQGL